MLYKKCDFTWLKRQIANNHIAITIIAFLTSVFSPLPFLLHVYFVIEREESALSSVEDVGMLANSISSFFLLLNEEQKTTLLWVYCIEQMELPK